MTRNPDVPCTRCGKLLWRSSTPATQRVCRECRRSEHSEDPSFQRCPRCQQNLPLGAFHESGKGKVGAYCRSCATQYYHQRRVTTSGPPRPAVCDDCGRRTDRRRTVYALLCAVCAVRRKKERDTRKTHLRRTRKRYTDIPVGYERQLRADTKRCPLCSVHLVEEPDKANSKNLDHIVPLAIGGTHTVGNVRIICRTCNLSRPKDGSDLSGHQPTLWAQDQQAVRQLVEQKRMCRCGERLRSGRCNSCQPSRRRTVISQAVGERAAELRAAGEKWQSISDALNLSGTGTAYQVASKWGKAEVVAKWPRPYAD